MKETLRLLLLVVYAAVTFASAAEFSIPCFCTVPCAISREQKTISFAITAPSPQRQLESLEPAVVTTAVLAVADVFCCFRVHNHTQICVAGLGARTQQNKMHAHARGH